jgi:hypothetical protein
MSKISVKLSVLCFIFIILAVSLNANDGVEYKYTLWLGGHADNFSDYTKKVGEFGTNGDDVNPEARFGIYGIGENFLLDMKGHYYDESSMSADFTGKYGDQFYARVKYMRFQRQLQTDLLANMDAREETAAGTPGGKMISHEDLDPGFDFRYNRNLVEAEVEALLDQEHDIKFRAAHRFWEDKGHEQQVASMHCFSCHLVSQAVPVERSVNQFNLGIEGKPGPVGLSYDFNYSKFKSDAAPGSVFYDEAKHPVNGSSAAEFDSRVIYANEEIEYNIYPETQKIGNKVRFFTRGTKYNFSGSANYQQVKNSVSDLEYKSYGAVLNFSMMLKQNLKLIYKTSVSRIDADDIFIELPLWRYDYVNDSAFTFGGQDFSFTRYSSLNRMQGAGSLELIMRLRQKTTIALLIGYDGVKRNDYPVKNADDASNTSIFQAKIKHREGLKYSLSFKYRLEKTDNPFTDYRGLFEAYGRDMEYQGRPYYYQREELKYQDITTLPTIKHAFDFKASSKASDKLNLNAGLRASFDKNDKLDSLDVKHTYFQPSVGFSATPAPKWVLAGGYRYNYMKSVGPVAVVMMDG